MSTANENMMGEDGKHNVVHHEFVPEAEQQTYAKDPNGEPVTVLGTMGQDPNAKPKIPISAWIIVGLAALGQLNNAYLGVSPAVAAGPIASSLGAPAKQQWLIQAQGIPSIVSGPIIAVITDVYGRKNAVLALLAMAIAACIVCMITTNIDVIIFGQTLNGVSAGISGLLFAIPSEVLPSRYRALVQGLMSGSGFFGVFIAFMSTGTAIAADPNNGWRWVWRVQLILNGIILLGIVLVYKPPPRTRSAETTLRHRVQQLDWIGYLLLTGGLVPLLMGFAWASDAKLTKSQWKDPHASAPVAVGFAAFIACGLWEWKGTSTGFLHHALFRHGWNFPLAVLLCAVEGDIFYLVNNIYTGEVFGMWFGSKTAMQQNACLLPFYVAVLLVTPLIMWYTTKTKDIKKPLIAGFALQLVGVVGLGTCTATSYARALAFNGVMGVGFASLLMLLITIIQLASPPLFIGVASALAISARTLGGTIGYGIALVIQHDVYDGKINGNVAKAVVPLGFDEANIPTLLGALSSHNATIIGQVPGANDAVVAAAQLAVTDTTAFAYGRVWYAAVPAIALGLIALWFVENPSKRMDWVVDAPLKSNHTEDNGVRATEEAHDEDFKS
ncbi:uncharacterized protein I303_106940 [Kwoniella dejecticola CBS 10117]|uniref:Major facilitator superfamily (MFS) profile domain-containing protein n=1 Tax=Kwoniella dejecticola CBS 10117 TaxID=1296121 RepID=A0A1A5ZTA0_9TREE|nr:uncharacterized protein I303_08421 [Kwoniella dejecticola CBS 10117]OBR81039.1 hypothetical protein I303_08421 [Kwoniella dejecticola CBS 10117]